jgi:putative transposase
MSLNALRRGTHVKIGESRFLIQQKLSDNNWQLQNTVTGEWCKFAEDELLDQFSRNELVFDRDTEDKSSGIRRDSAGLGRTESPHPVELVVMAQNRVQYLKEIDRLQPIAITWKTMEPLIQSVSQRINDTKPPGWRTLARDYSKWLRAGRDIHAVLSRHSDKGSRGPRMIPEVRSATDEVIDELYMTEERKRVPEVYMEIVRRLADANRIRPVDAPLPIPSRRTIYRAIERRSPYELMVARYGKRRAEMEFRVSGSGPETSRALQRVSMDHTPGDMIVVDDATLLPLGRPTITSALDEHTRCPTGFYTGFEPPSCLSVMRCLKHAILPKTYVPREFPSVKNAWECYGVPELVVVDNPPEFHSRHFERACLQIGTDIQYAKVLVPWYKGKLEHFQGTMNHDLLHGNPGSTFSNILERDDYDPTRHAVVLLSTFREMLHKWIIDVYLQTPHRGIKDTPAHRWHSDVGALPPPLPPSAGELEVALGMTAQRVVFHYGVELEGLKYNSPELGELRRRIGVGAKVELTFDPGDLGHINVLDPQKGAYILVPAVNQSYAKGLSFWQNKVVRRFAQRELDARTDIVALAQAKEEIRALVERDFNRKATRGRKRHARFMEDHAAPATSEVVSAQITADAAEEHPKPPAEVNSTSRRPSTRCDAVGDDEILPVFDADLDLPRLSAAVLSSAGME